MNLARPRNLPAGRVPDSEQPSLCSNMLVHRGWMDPFEVQFGDSNDSGQGVWSESKRVVVNLSQSVFSIASFKGDVMLCACSGIVIRCEPLITTLLTSASLLRSSHDESRIEDDLTIRVHYKYQQYINGQLGDYDLDYNLLVNIKTPPLPVARLDHQVQLESCSKVLAVGRIFNSRKLMATSGLVKDTISIFDQEEIAISTCKISKAGIGGPLIDVDGYFHGMNFYGVEETPFLPRSLIIKCLRSFAMFRQQNEKHKY